MALFSKISLVICIVKSMVKASFSLNFSLSDLMSPEFLLPPTKCPPFISEVKSDLLLSKTSSSGKMPLLRAKKSPINLASKLAIKIWPVENWPLEKFFKILVNSSRPEISLPCSSDIFCAPLKSAIWKFQYSSSALAATTSLPLMMKNIGI